MRKTSDREAKKVHHRLRKLQRNEKQLLDWFWYNKRMPTNRNITTGQVSITL